MVIKSGEFPGAILPFLPTLNFGLFTRPCPLNLLFSGTLTGFKTSKLFLFKLNCPLVIVRDLNLEALTIITCPVILLISMSIPPGAEIFWSFCPVKEIGTLEFGCKIS